MKAFKKLTALLLTLCLLAGLPLSVSAVDTTAESATELRLVGAQPVVGTEGDVLIYYSEPIANHNSSTIRLVVVDEKKEVVSYNGNSLYWKTNNDTVYLNKNGYNGYRSSISSSITSTEGETVDTWEEIVNLLAKDSELSGKGYRLQVRIYEKDSLTSGNGTVDSVYNVSETIQLSSNDTDADTAASVGITTKTVRDYACIDIGIVEAGDTEMTLTGVITLDGVRMIDETSMWLNFSQAVTIDIARTDAKIEVVDNAGTIFKTVAVTLNEGNDKIVRAALSDSTWTEIEAIWSVNTTRTIRLTLTENNLNEANAEFANGYTVDTVRGTESNMPLQSDLYEADANNAERMDYVTAVVEGPQLLLVGAQPVLSAMHSSDKTQLMYFNQDIVWEDSAVVRVVVADSNNDVVTYNDTYLYWRTDNGGESSDGYNGYRSTLNSVNVVTNSAGVTVDTWTEIIDLLANDAELSGKGYRLQIRMYDKSSSIADNGVIDTVVAKADSTLKLSANYTHVNPTSVGLTGNSRDCAYIDLGTVAAGATAITPTGVITLDRVQMTDETNMTLTFSDAVTIDTERTDAKIEVVGTLGTIFTEAAVTLTKGNAKAVKATLTDATWTQIQAAWSGNSTRTIRLTLTEKNLAAAKAEFANSYTVDTVRGTGNEMPLQSKLYAADAENAEHMDYLTATVEEPQARALTQNETVKTLVVNADTTLDLNGYTLTVTNLQSFGDIVDSTEGKGGIKVSQDTEESGTLILQPGNSMLPLYDAQFGGYRFFDCTLVHKQGETDYGYRFGYQMNMSDEAFKLLVDADGNGEIDADIQLDYNVKINVDGTEDTLNHYFKTAILTEYGTKQLLDDGKTYAATLKVTGFDAITDQTVTITSFDPQIVSSTGVVITASNPELSYTYPNTQQGE